MDIALMLALALSDATPPLPAPPSGESDITSLAEVPGLLPGMSPVELVEEGSLVVLVAYPVEIVEGMVVVVGAAEGEVGE